jgi:hypothetical protein
MAIRYVEEKPKIRYIKESMPEDNTIYQESLVNIIDRARLSFGNRLGNKTYLESLFDKDNVKELVNNKWIVRKDNKWYAIDPETKTIKDIPGDIADILGDLPEIAGFGVGVTAGTSAAGLGGSIAGAGAGQAIGTGIKQVIGAIAGTYKPTSVLQPAKEQTMSGITGAGTQMVFGVGGKMLSGLSKVINKLGSRATRIFTGLSKETLERTSEKGISKILTPEKTETGYLQKVAERVQDGIKNLHDKLNIEWKSIVEKALGGKETMPINVDKPLTNFFENMRKAGFLDDANNLRLSTKLDPTSRIKLRNFYDYMKNITERIKSTSPTPLSSEGAIMKTTELTKPVTAALDLRDALRLKDDMWRLAKQLDPSESRIAKKFYVDLVDEITTKIPDLKPVNKEMTNIFTIQDYLGSKLGLKTELEKIDITTQPVTQLKNFVKRGSTERRVLETLDKKLPKEYKFMDDFIDGVAAEDWVNNSGSVNKGIGKFVAENIFKVSENPSQISSKLLQKPITQKSLSVLSPVVKGTVSQKLIPTNE